MLFDRPLLSLQPRGCRLSDKQAQSYSAESYCKLQHWQ